MNLHDIVEDKNKQLNIICKNTKEKLYSIISKEFVEFDKVEIICPKGDYDIIILYKGKEWIKFFLAPLKYDNNSYIRKAMHGNNNFTKSEIKTMIKRLDKLCGL